MKVKTTKRRPPSQEDLSSEAYEMEGKKIINLSSILEKAPPVFPWLFSNETMKSGEQNKPEMTTKFSVSRFFFNFINLLFFSLYT